MLIRTTTTTIKLIKPITQLTTSATKARASIMPISTRCRKTQLSPALMMQFQARPCNSRAKKSLKNTVIKVLLLFFYFVPISL